MLESVNTFMIVPWSKTMTRQTLLTALFVVFAFSASGKVIAAGDAARGSQVFRQCAACHSTAPGDHMTGPSLAHVWNRKAGAAEGFMRYSDALKGSGVTWNAATLDKWLASPEKFLPGNSMTFPGVRDSQARQDLIAYLRSVDERKAPPAPKGGGGMMGMARQKTDLKSAPPAGQVRSIKYCGDTYTVDTADGKTEKIWEFNLRFKSDSSKLGPNPGQPVVVGAGMQGDRASVVFASPKEIGNFIQQVCP
jgi:cytochrome c